MNKVRHKFCSHCGISFKPDPRAAKVQKFCSRKPCQRTRQRRKYRRWVRQPGNAAVHQEALRTWAKDTDYWKRYRATHPDYVRRDNLRRALSLRRARRSAKQTDWQEIAVDRLHAIQSLDAPEYSAKQTDLARRLDSVVEYLLWTVETPCSAKPTGMAWAGGSAA